MSRHAFIVTAKIVAASGAVLDQIIHHFDAAFGASDSSNFIALADEFGRIIDRHVDSKALTGRSGADLVRSTCKLVVTGRRQTKQELALFSGHTLVIDRGPAAWELDEPAALLAA